MKKILTLFISLLIIVEMIFFCGGCVEWNEESVEIERFEYLDGLRSEYDENDSLLVESYLVHNYRKKYDAEIQQITDKFICDSIIPNSRFPRFKFIVFFKRTKNTNRENFQTLPKHKNIHARTHDKLFSYRIIERDSVVGRIRKILEAFDEEIVFQDFYCD